MASRNLLSLLLLAQLSAAIVTILATTSPATQPKFPAILIFGDSTVDAGNNNYISTFLQSDHKPYGSAFPGQKATGRFSNGRLVPDFLASELGIKELVPPFLDPSLSDEDIRTGVSFASAGSGYDDLTAELSQVIAVSKQPELFKKYLDRLKLIVGEQEASKIVSEALILFSAGTNDFLFCYYDIPTRRLQYNISGYQDFLLQKLQTYVKQIYDLGGRKFAIASLPPIGCVPIQLFVNSLSSNGACIDQENIDALAYNSKLQHLLPKLESSLTGSRIIYGDIYVPLMDMIKRPDKYGFTEVKKGCCATGLMEMAYTCNTFTPTCSDASKYLFWDSVHPTDLAYKSLTAYLNDNYIKLFQQS